MTPDELAECDRLDKARHRAGVTILDLIDQVRTDDRQAYDALILAIGRTGAGCREARAAIQEYTTATDRYKAIITSHGDDFLMEYAEAMVARRAAGA